MSKQQKTSGTIMDVSLAMVMLALLFAGVYNTIAVNRLTKLEQINKAHICGLTNMMFGPVNPEGHIELCNSLRDDLYSEWLIYQSLSKP